MEKEIDKITKYQDLGRELRRLWNVQTEIVPVVIGTLGSMLKDFVALVKSFRNKT